MPRRGSFRTTMSVLLAIASVAVVACAGAASPTIDHWDPAAFHDLPTLEFKTVGADEGEHWSTVWLAVIDGQVYVRLGARAAARMRGNTTAPIVAVRIGGHEYPRVRAEEAAAMAPPVAAAMGDKYWSDVLIRHFPHELTMRLTPEADAPAH